MQSILMRKCVAEQILGKSLEISSTNLEIYSLDVEVILEGEVIEPKQFCIIPLKRSREKQLVELNECRTLTIKFGIIGETVTSNEKTVLLKCFVVLCESLENNPMVYELEYGLECQCSRERTHHAADKDDFEP